MNQYRSTNYYFLIVLSLFISCSSFEDDTKFYNELKSLKLESQKVFSEDIKEFNAYTVHNLLLNTCWIESTPEDIVKYQIQVTTRALDLLKSDVTLTDDSLHLIHKTLKRLPTSYRIRSIKKYSVLNSK